MKKALILAGFLALAPMAHSAPLATRGSRCQDEVCFEQARQDWRVAIALADGRYAHRIDKMLAKWTQKGFPETYIAPAFAKIDAQFHKEVMAAGMVWFYEVQGYDREHTTAIVDSTVINAEIEINQTLIPLWLGQSGE